MEDERIIELFFERSEQAIRELDAKYGKLLQSVSYAVLNNHSDAEECVNDAYLAAWNAIPPAKPESLLGFVCKIVRNVSRKRYERNTAKKRNSRYDVALEELEECLYSGITVEAEIEAEELTRAIEAFLDSLSKENRIIFLRRYWFSDSYAEIAKRVGISEKNVSVRLTRLRKDLRAHLSEREVL
ncbi:MAG: RNA polymerase sigma factor [Clostridia bacterium]|nr:RNA polymerase sigma factor [Clostridia bacterium]